jgi:SAM-dependent methyltransferase
LREHVKQIIEVIARRIELPEPIVELGALQVEAQVGWADLRPFFPGRHYIGCDFREGPGVDQIENPEIGFSFNDDTIGSLITCDTFEHIFDVFKTVREIKRVLMPDGILVVISVMYWPIHAYPHDYWRFTPECFRRLLEEFADAIIIYLGDKMFPHTVIGVARKAHVFPESFRDRIQKEILALPTHQGSAWKSPREKELEKTLQEALIKGEAEVKNSARKSFRWFRSNNKQS